MIKLKYILTILLFNLILSLSLASQELNDSILSLYEDSVIVQIQSISKRNSDNKNYSINDTINKLLTTLISDKNSFSYTFPKLKNYMSVLTSPDDLIRIYNWNIQKLDGSFLYFGFLQYKFDKKNIVTYKLTDSSSVILDAANTTLTYNNWFGVLYYDIVIVTINKQKHYTLLGWDGNDMFTNKKIIDVLYFKNDTIPYFGKPIFCTDIQNPEKKQNRFIIEYSYQANITLRYNDKMEMIVFDHVSASDRKYEGHYEYYGADFSYDAFDFENDNWVIKYDVDIRNPKPTNEKKIKKPEYRTY